MTVLLLRVSGPMQSWGVQSRFTIRDTGLEPSKSGVIGLCCAALGRHRGAPIADLAGLRMAVRADQEGVLARDFHTAQDILTPWGNTKSTETSTRYYLADARFLVGLEGDVEVLRRVHHALRNPHWPLYLGRKAFVPGEPVWLEDGLQLGAALEEALPAYPWLGNDPRRRPERVRVVWEDPSGAEARPDQPLSFEGRQFAVRRVRTTFVAAPPLREEGA
jgi:CRISPR system Cascade subunit CasD